MIPGTTSKLSESTVASATSIQAKTDIVHVTGSVAINTIIPNFGGGFSGLLILNSLAGVTLGTTGNILVGLAVVTNRPVVMVFSRALNKWLITA